MKTSQSLYSLGLPRAELVVQGLADLKEGRLTEKALIVLVASPRLRHLGVKIPDQPLSRSCEHELYACLERSLGWGRTSITTRLSGG